MEDDDGDEVQNAQTEEDGPSQMEDAEPGKREDDEDDDVVRMHEEEQVQQEQPYRMVHGDDDDEDDEVEHPFPSS